jgi:hypothetical protein
MPQQETHKSLTNKLRRAKLAIEEHRREIVGPPPGRHTEADIDELHLSNIEEYWDLVYQCIQIVLKEKDPRTLYRRPKPPGKQTKDKGLSYGKHMIPFRIEHPDFDFPLYFKFCIVEEPKGYFTYCHIDCHGPREHHEF